MTPDALHDNELVQRFHRGDASAFTAIMQRHRNRIFAAAMGVLHNHADAEEITQDTFVRAHRGLANFRGDSSLATWLHRIAINLARNRYWYFFRRRRSQTLSLDAELGTTEGTATFSDLISADDGDPSRRTSLNEFSSAVEACLARMEPGHRKILLLRTALDKSYEEIAALLGINVGTVKSRIARARERLRSLLAEECLEFSLESDPADWFEPDRGMGQIAMAAC